MYLVARRTSLYYIQFHKFYLNNYITEIVYVKFYQIQIKYILLPALTKLFEILTRIIIAIK